MRMGWISLIGDKKFTLEQIQDWEKLDHRHDGNIFGTDLKIIQYIQKSSTVMLLIAFQEEKVELYLEVDKLNKQFIKKFTNWRKNNNKLTDTELNWNHDNSPDITKSFSGDSNNLGKLKKALVSLYKHDLISNTIMMNSLTEIEKYFIQNPIIRENLTARLCLHDNGVIDCIKTGYYSSEITKFIQYFQKEKRFYEAIMWSYYCCFDKSDANCKQSIEILFSWREHVDSPGQIHLNLTNDIKLTYHELLFMFTWELASITYNADDYRLAALYLSQISNDPGINPAISFEVSLCRQCH